MTESPSLATTAPDHADSSASATHGPLTGRTVVFLTADEGVERVELTSPRQAMLDAGATVLLASPSGGRVLLFDHLDHAGTEPADSTLEGLDMSDVAGIVLPGGVANPDQLRLNSVAVGLLRDALDSGLPVAAVCHGAWTLIETGKLAGRTLTSWPSLRTDLTNAGARWVDEPVVVDTQGEGTLVSSRKPDDLVEFSRAAVEAFSARPVS
jgi:protease I